MGECMLDSCGEDGFQSSEGFDDWSTFSSADWTEPQQHDDRFSVWGEFQDDTGKEEELSFTPEVKTGTSELPDKRENSNHVRYAFHECFHDDGPEKEPLMLDIPTLFQLLQSKTDLPSQSAGISSEASKFWHLQSDSKLLRLSDPKPKLHSHERLLKTLQLRHPDTSTASQSIILSDPELDKPEDHPAALIQTKLIPPSHCQKAPGFFYQISRQWLSQYSRNLHQND